MIIGMIEVRWWVIRGVHNMNLLLHWEELMPTPQKNQQPERETNSGVKVVHMIPLPPSIAQSIPQLLTPHLPTPPLSCPFHPSIAHSIYKSPIPSLNHPVPSLNCPVHPSISLHVESTALGLHPLSTVFTYCQWSKTWGKKV